jgi:hypothetical protein
MKTACTIGTLALLAALGCGDDKTSPDKGSGAKGTEGTTPAPVALTAPPLGVESVKKLNYAYGDGADAYKKVRDAYKATPRDWAAVKAAAQATIVLDAGHLDAHRVLANALAQESDFAGTSKHLLIALAGDWGRWGAIAETDAELAAYWKAPEGEAMKKLLATMRDDFATRAAGGIKLLGRRSTFKWPAKSGAQWATTRGELYAHDLESKRFVRLTHTDHELAAWMPSPSGDEVVLLGYGKVELPDAKKSPDAPPTFKNAWIKIVDPVTWEAKGKAASITTGRAIAVHYAAGDQLMVTTYAPAKRWGLGAATSWSLDRTTGKLTKTKAAAPEGERVVMTFDDVVFEGPLAGVEADWAGEPRSAGSFRLGDNKQPVTLSGGAMALEASFAWSPTKTRAAFATASDPCAKKAEDQKSAIYVVDVATGKLKHLLTAQSRFGARWLDEDRLVYEDDAGALRVYDAAAGKELAQLKEKAGMALRGLAASPKTLCKATFVPEVAPVEEGGVVEGPTETDGEAPPVP